jgi:cytoskeletal protein CcmA (bactofilin family)
VKMMNEMINGNLSITENLEFHGTVNGNAEVMPTIFFKHYGVITGNLAIGSGSKVEVHGVVNGDLVNKGKVFIAGTIKGKVVELSGDVIMAKNAIVGGKVF